jgi:hypothetical protein
VYANRPFEIRKQIVDEQRQPRNVIEMSVSKNDIADLPAVIVGGREAEAAGVDRDAVVDDERR